MLLCASVSDTTPSDPGAEVLTPREHDHVGAGFDRDRDDVIGGNAKLVEEHTRSCGVGMWSNRNSRSHARLSSGL